MIFPDFEFGERSLILVLGKVILEGEASVPDGIVLKHNVGGHVAQGYESDFILERGLGQAAELFLIQWTTSTSFVEISGTGEDCRVLTCSIHLDRSEVVSSLWSGHGWHSEVLVLVSEPLSFVDTEGNETLLLNWIENVEAAGLPLELLTVLVFQNDVRSRVVTEADLCQIFQFHGLLEPDLESLDLGEADEGSGHHVEGGMI